jgi:predicted Zn-dependent peptidase
VTDSSFKKIHFDSGLCLVSERNPYSRSVVVGLWFPVGSRFEQPGEFGSYHFIEHLVFKSPKALKIVKQIELAGGDVNAFTAHEHTCYHVTCLKQDVGFALKFLACIRSHFDVSPDDFEKEKAVILQEVRSHQDDIEDEVHRFFMSKVLSGSALAHSISGEIEDVASLSLNGLKTLHFKSYTNGQCVISIAGNFEFELITDLIEKEFRCSKIKDNRSIKNSKKVKTVVPYYGFDFSSVCDSVTKHFQPGLYLKERKTKQLYFTLSFPIKAIFSDERFPASLLNAWFGQGMTSHLFKKLREDLGLVYFVHSHISTFLDQGLWMIEASCEIQNMPEVIEMIFFELKKLRTKIFSPSWLRAQKKLLRGQVLLGADDLENRMQSIALNELIFQEYRSPEEYLNKFEKVNGSEIKSFIKERINFSQCAVVLYGQKAKEFQPFVEKLIERQS